MTPDPAPEPEDYEVSAFEPPYPEPEIGPDRRAKACAFGVVIALGIFTAIGMYCAACEIWSAIGHLLTGGAS